MINSFRKEYFFLSNFYDKSPMIYEGKEYKTSEHLFQALKAKDPIEAEQIRLAETPRDAKNLGRICKMVDDWDNIKISKMRLTLEIKFSDPKLMERLLGTGDEELIEGNNWGDRFWGVDGTGKII